MINLIKPPILPTVIHNVTNAEGELKDYTSTHYGATGTCENCRSYLSVWITKGERVENTGFPCFICDCHTKLQRPTLPQ